MHWYVHRHPSEHFAGNVTAQSRACSNVKEIVPLLSEDKEAEYAVRKYI